jgi:hypothetical protein
LRAGGHATQPENVVLLSWTGDEPEIRQEIL